MQRKFRFLILSFLCINLTNAQGIKGPETPTFKTFEPVKQSQGTLAGQQQNTVKTETNNENRPLLQPRSPESIVKSFNQNNYKLNAQSQVPSKNMNSVELVHSVVNDVYKQDDLLAYHFPTLQSQTGTNFFNDAYKELSDMLEGKKPLDLKRAVFLTENAFFGNQMKYEDYEKKIQSMTNLIRLKMQQENMTLNDNDALNFMVHQYMSDTLSIKIPQMEKTLTTFPMTYDFEDPFGYENPTKMFVSKLINDNTGQCKTLPLLYLVLVYELGGNAYLSFSPSHSFIKCKNNNNAWYNVELTNGRLSSYQWLMGSGYVKSESVKGGIYLDTLNKKQVIANCLIDLGHYYSYRYLGFDDFVLKCTNKALSYHPTNIQGLQLKADYYSYLYEDIAKKKGYTNGQEMKPDPAAKEILLQRNRMYALLDGLGFENMPEDAYIEWLKTLDIKAQEQIEQEQYGKFRQIMR